MATRQHGFSKTSTAPTTLFTPGRSGLLQRKCACGGTPGPAGECAECRQKRLQRKTPNSELGTRHEGVVPPIVDEVLRSSGQPLDGSIRAFMEPRFGRDFSQVRTRVSESRPVLARLAIGAPNDEFEQEADMMAEHALNRSPVRTETRHDFSGVKIHTDAKAAESAQAVNARAYTVRRNIVFGAGQFAPGTHEGRRLLAHELTHVVQQESNAHQAPLLQRQSTFGGGAGGTALDRDRPIVGYAGPMPYTANPGGTVIPNTAGTTQNCAGDSCSISRWINWPFLGFEVPNVPLQGAGVGDWSRATNFVPSGCTRVNCSGVDVNNTRCRITELELIAYLYRWPVTRSVGGTPMAGTQSDFHMMGRDAGGLPSGWHSKMDRRERVADIRVPLQSLHDAYPHTLRPDRTIQQLCFCCNQTAIRAT